MSKKGKNILTWRPPEPRTIKPPNIVKLTPEHLAVLKAVAAASISKPGFVFDSGFAKTITERLTVPKPRIND